MREEYHGLPCWYELTTPDPALDGAFYSAVLGWDWDHSPMEGMEYSVARMKGAMVAGMMAPPDPGIPPNWLIYFTISDCDATVDAMVADGATLLVPPSDIPGTGRFAALTDPQGAAFALLQPLPGGAGGAFDQTRTGHGNWHELTTPDPVAAVAFYARHLGLNEVQAMDMGPMGKYHILGSGDRQIGGVMRAPGAEFPPFWMPYFGVDSIDGALARLTAAGGAVQHGPAEVPGGAFIVQARDPRGAWFAVVGPR